MNGDQTTARLLGAAFLLVFAASLLAGVLRTAAIGSGEMADVLVRASSNEGLLRASALVELVTAAGIVVLAALLYVVLRTQNRLIALVGLGWWLVEAAALAVSKLGTLALIPLARQSSEAGADGDLLHSLGAFADSLDGNGYDIHMVFYCLGGIVWFYLFYGSRFIPRVLAVWGLVAESVALIAMVLALAGVAVNIVFFAHIAVLELAVGLWLAINGIRTQSV